MRHFGLSEPSAETLRRAHETFPVTAVESEYSLWTRDPEAEVLPLCAQRGIGFGPFSPLGKGFFTGTLHTDAAPAPGEVRSSVPRLQPENLAANQPLLDHVRELAQAHDATPAQVALAWLLAQGPSIVPIPGTRRRERLEENVAATGVALSADDVAGLNSLLDHLGVAGERYDEDGMSLVGR